MAFSFLTQELAMDLGTANTVIFQNDQIVLDEPSIVAIDNNTGKALALGQKAKLMQERENPGIKTVRPMKDGVIADFNAAEMMIRGFIKQVNSRRRSLFTPNIKMVIGIPSGLTDGMTICIEPMINAGEKSVYLAKNGWAVHTADHSRSAHFELTVVVRKGRAEQLSTFDFIENNVKF